MAVSETSSGVWLPLMEFAARRNVSLSTLRRHIKAKKVLYRLEGGRYLIFDSEPGGGTLASAAASANVSPASAKNQAFQFHELDFGESPFRAAIDPLGLERAADSTLSELREEVSLLKDKLSQVHENYRKAQEEIAELKTLVAFLEESSAP
jgi:hypothetical protein